MTTATSLKQLNEERVALLERAHEAGLFEAVRDAVETFGRFGYSYGREGSYLVESNLLVNCKQHRRSLGGGPSTPIWQDYYVISIMRLPSSLKVLGSDDPKNWHWLLKQYEAVLCRVEMVEVKGIEVIDTQNVDSFIARGDWWKPLMKLGERARKTMAGIGQSALKADATSLEQRLDAWERIAA